ncbi:hypothetical protein OC861_001657 [Tilletia horrida]|nr:hypothetical protein OC861_001657 [Tilletia horrida]
MVEIKTTIIVPQPKCLKLRFSRTSMAQAAVASGNAAIVQHSFTLKIPFPNAASARLVADVLSVDRQLRPQEVTVDHSVIGSTLVVWALDRHFVPFCFRQIDASSIRQLRLSINATLENAALVTKTMDAFGPSALPTPSSHGLPERI